MADPVASLLLAATRLAPGGAPDCGLVEWHATAEAAARHSVAPLLARWLAARPEGVPPDVLASLRARYDANALRNVALTQMLSELLARLAANGIAAMPVKGPALAISAYGDLALREFGDLDVVVHPGAFDRARDLLAGEGYRPLAQLSSAGLRALRRSDHHLPMVHEGTGVAVELHWSLDNGRPGRSLDGDWVWANARTVSLLGCDHPTLSWSALLVYLCVHGAKHGFTRLGWIRDIAGVLAAAPAGELATVPRLAANAEARRRLALGVALARGMLGAPEREELPSCATPDVAALEGEVRTRLFAPEEMGRRQWVSFQCRSFDRARDRAGYLWHLLAQPHVADVESFPLPRRLGWLYYVLRPSRLTTRSLGRLYPRRASGGAPP